MTDKLALVKLLDEVDEWAEHVQADRLSGIKRLIARIKIAQSTYDQDTLEESLEELEQIMLGLIGFPLSLADRLNDEILDLHRDFAVPQSRRELDDDEAMDKIHRIVDKEEWCADTVKEIAQIVARTGREIEEV